MAGVWDMEKGEATRIDLPATCWHLIPHPQKDIFYAVSFRVLPRDHKDYHEWAMAFLEEYAFEIDAKEKKNFYGIGAAGKFLHTVILI